MADFEFHLTLAGSGATREEAWQDAVDAFALDPRIPQEGPQTSHEKPLRLEVKDSGSNIPRSVYLVNEGMGLGLQFPGFRSETDVGPDPIVIIEFREGMPYVLVWADRTQEDPTHSISLEKAAYGPRCPLEPRDHEVAGCGSYNVALDEEEGDYDCLDCGLFFTPEEADTSACSTDGENP